MRIVFLLPVFISLYLFASSLDASTYNDKYTLLKDANATQKDKTDYFMDGNFDEIIRFDKIFIDDSSINTDGKLILQEVIDKVKAYSKDSKKVILKIIGHSAQDNDAIEKSKEYALTIQNYLLNANVDKNITIIEYRGDKDPLHLSTFTALSNRVMISMYVNLPKDLDQDGVEGNDDKCPDTEKGMLVAEDGCKIKNLIILLPQEKTNSAIIISTEKESIKVNKPNQLVSIKSKDFAPSSPKDINEDELTSILGNVHDSANKKQLSYILYFHKTNLTEESEIKLQDILTTVSKLSNPYIQIIGHTDTVGKASGNQVLGLKRAQTVAKRIVDNDISYLKLETQSYGESNLAIPTANNVKENFNKRVEIFIY